MLLTGSSCISALLLPFLILRGRSHETPAHGENSMKSNNQSDQINSNSDKDMIDGTNGQANEFRVSGMDRECSGTLFGTVWQNDRLKWCDRCLALLGQTPTSV